MTYKIWRRHLVITSLGPPTFRRTLLAISLATTFLFCFRTGVFGVPASPEPFIYRQPDGTAFWARKVGDERSHVVETAAGFTVLRDVPSGKWFYAVANEEGELEKSPFLVGQSSPRELGIRKHLRISNFRGKEKGLSVRPGKTAFQTLTAPAKESGSLLAAKSDQPTAPSTIKNLVTITVVITPFRIAYIGLESVLVDRTALSIMWFGIPGASYSVFRSEDLLVWECMGSAISVPEGSEQGDWLFYREEMTGSAEIRFFYRVSME